MIITTVMIKSADTFDRSLCLSCWLHISSTRRDVIKELLVAMTTLKHL